MNPLELQSGGQALWDSVVKSVSLNAGELAILEEACRAKDNLDRLHRMEVAEPGADLQASIRGTTLTMKRLIAALRLPDPVTGRRPQRRGARGVYQPRRTS